MSMYGKKWAPHDFKDDKGFTNQSEREDADINSIIKRLTKSGVARMNQNPPFYADVSEFSDLQGSLIKVQRAQEAFMELDADIRERFENDPVKLINFLEDPKNLDEAVKLGIVESPAASQQQASAVPEQPK